MLGSPLFLLLAPVGLAFGIACFVRSMSGVDRGLHLLIVAVFFGSLVGVNLGSGAFAIIFRDAFIVLPLYLGFFASRTGVDAMARIPSEIFLTLFLLCCVIGLGTLNFAGAKPLQVAIGLKVWLFYIPLIVIGIAVASDPQLLTRMLRVMFFWGTLACAVGLLQAFLVRTIGYQPAIELFYGSHAYSVTQTFAYFGDVGGVYRIPGTFSFSAQYSGFTYVYLTLAVILSNADPNPRIRSFAGLAVFAAVLACVLSGARSAIIVTPLFLLLFMASGVVKSRLLVLAPIGIAALAAAIAFSGLELLSFFAWGLDLLTSDDGFQYAASEISGGLEYGLFGMGVGRATGPARYAFTSWSGDVDDTFVCCFESYFAKASAELGWLGLLIVALLFAAIFLRVGSAFLSNRRNRGNAIIAPTAIYVGYNMLSSARGWPLDLDPGNIFFWLFLGLAIGVDRLQKVVWSADQTLDTAYAATLPSADAALAQDGVAEIQG